MTNDVINKVKGRNNPSSLLINLCTPTKFFQMVELL